MRTQVTDQIIVNASAKKAWLVLAHEFDQVGKWSSGIKESKPLIGMDIIEGAPVGGRVCLSDDIFGDAEEAFTYYDEDGMRFGYQAVGELPRFFNEAENNWHVEPINTNQALVEFKADVDLALFPGMLMVMFKPIIKKLLGTRTLEELKYYIENDQPHPRKAKQQS